MQYAARYSQPVLERQLRRNITTTTEVYVHVLKCTTNSHFPVSGACACACELTSTSFELGEGADGDEGGGILARIDLHKVSDHLFYAAIKLSRLLIFSKHYCNPYPSLSCSPATTHRY